MKTCETWFRDSQFIMVFKKIDSLQLNIAEVYPESECERNIFSADVFPYRKSLKKQTTILEFIL